MVGTGSIPSKKKIRGNTAVLRWVAWLGGLLEAAPKQREDFGGDATSTKKMIITRLLSKEDKRKTMPKTVPIELFLVPTVPTVQAK